MNLKQLCKSYGARNATSAVDCLMFGLILSQFILVLIVPFCQLLFDRDIVFISTGFACLTRVRTCHNDLRDKLGHSGYIDV